MDINQSIDDIRIKAIEEFTIKSITPLFGRVNQKIDQIGTGTFFKMGEKRLLITANHIFDNIVISDGVYLAKSPENKPNYFELYRLEKFDLLTPNKELKDLVDVAIIDFTDYDDIQTLERNWHFLPITQIQGKTIDKIHGSVIITGYPSERLSNMLNTSAFITAYTKLLDSVPKNIFPGAIPYDKRVDLYFEYRQEAISIPNNNIINTPNAIGMSGCPIWEYVSSKGIWSPEKSLYIIGIQSSFVHKQYIRGKSSFAVNELLDKAFDNNSDSINAINK